MIMMKCMACHAKISMPDGLATCETTCPKCRMRTLVGLETSGGRRLRAIEVSRIIRDMVVIFGVFGLAFLNMRYVTEATKGTVWYRVFAPLTPGVLFCLFSVWMYHYIVYFWNCILLGRSGLYGIKAGVKKRLAWIGCAIAAVGLLFYSIKTGVAIGLVCLDFVKKVFASDAAVGTVVMLFLVQYKFNTHDDYLSRCRWSRESSDTWTTDLPLWVEIVQCYGVCILLTFTGLLIACGPEWFAGTTFGKGLGIVNGFFTAIYGLFGGLAKMIISLVVGLVGFIVSLFG